MSLHGDHLSWLQMVERFRYQFPQPTNSRFDFDSDSVCIGTPQRFSSDADGYIKTYLAPVIS